jgi:ribulose-5-phosphate 4-epimerase/fuculose-1-phosphate aldolase
MPDATTLEKSRPQAARWSAAEQAAREELAGLYRLFDVLGWHELIYNHITVRAPDERNCFLINPFGLMYREVKASNLVKIDIDGNVVGSSAYGVNPAGFVVHSAVHRNRHDAHCVMHTHTTAGLAVACQKDGLLPMSFPAAFYTDRISYHDFEGITLDTDECDRLAKNLGTNNVMILRNHGLLTCGPTAADAFGEMFHLQRACEVQIAAMSGGAKINMPPIEVSRRAAKQFEGVSRQGPQNGMLLAAMLRWMDDVSPGFRD